MAGRLTWKALRPITAGVYAQPAIRVRWGDAVADLVERFAHIFDTARTRPSAQDIKRTLRSVAMAPASVPLRRLDPFTRAELQGRAWALFRIRSLQSLPPESLAACARAALAAFTKNGGGPAKDRIATMMVRALLDTMPTTMPPADRDAMLADCLLACGLGAGRKNVERLRTAAASAKSARRGAR